MKKQKRRRLRKVELYIKEVILIEGQVLDAVFFTTINDPAWERETKLSLSFTCDKGTAKKYLKEVFDLEVDKITSWDSPE